MDPKVRKAFELEVAQRDTPALVSFLSDNDLFIDRIESLRSGSHDYFLYLQLTAERRRQLGLMGDEILAIILHQHKQQSWFLDVVRGKLRSHDRLAKTAVIVVSSDPDIVKICAGARPDRETGYKTAFVGFVHKDIRLLKDSIERTNWLAQAFTQQAFVVDQFDTRFPVPDDLFGRAALLSQLEHDVVQGELGVALLGIRRVGKTSVLKRLISQVASHPSSSWIVALYDAQEHSVDADATTTAKGLLRELRVSANAVNIQFQRNDGADALSDLPAQVKWIIEHHRKHILLAIDEIEWLVPTSDAPNPVEKMRKEREYVRLFGVLRALKQKYPSEVGIVVCGINETFCGLTEVAGVSNPSLDMFQTHYVPLLDSKVTIDMLKIIGARMAISYEAEFLSKLWSAFAGHAYLARQFCSAIVRKYKSRPLILRSSDFDGEYQDFLQHRADGIIKQVLQHLARFYPEDYYVLHRISHGFHEATMKDSIRHLHQYGLVTDSSQPTLTMDALQRFVGIHSLQEVSVGRFSLFQRLGEGATGVVWRAWDRQVGEERALKMYSGAVTREMAEVEYKNLISLASEAVPRAYEIVDTDDRLALVMEYIPGRSLAMIIRESGGKFTPDAIQSLTENILAAVGSLHPSPERKELLKKQLQEKSQITEEELNEYFRLSESGYLHRDLKPDNIIITDERKWLVKLIDVQLARKFDEANQSRVGTPAYMPIDWGISKWDVSFDLYSLTVIFHEILFGVRPLRDSPLSLINSYSTNVNKQQTLTDFVERGLGTSTSIRFKSISEMRQAWEDFLTTPG